mgnify:CR=1 FL=1
MIVAVVSDLAAGEHPLHAATLGLVAASVAGVRVRLAGRHSSVFSVLSGALVAQPVLHAAVKLLPLAPDPVHHAAETSISAIHIAITVTIVAVVTGAQSLVLALATACPRVDLLLPAPRTPSDTGPRISLVERTTQIGPQWLFTADVSRRGPPGSRPVPA